MNSSNLVEPERKGIEVVRIRLPHEVRSESGRIVAELMAAVWPGQGASDQERRARIAMEVEECCEPGGERGARLYQIYQVLGIRREDELAGALPEFKPETTLKLISRVLARVGSQNHSLVRGRRAVGSSGIESPSFPLF